MMTEKKKKNTLQAALNSVSPGTKKGEGRVVKSPKRPVPKKPATAPKPPSRRDTVQVAAHLSPAYAKQLRILAAEDDTTNQALIQEALDLLFLKKGKQHV